VDAMKLPVDAYNNVYSVADDDQKQYAGIVRNVEISLGTPVIKLKAQALPVMNGKTGSLLIGTDCFGGTDKQLEVLNMNTRY
jgi:hypothetical protein